MTGKNRRMSYQRKIFLYFMAIAIVPLFLLGNFSYISAVKALRKNTRQSNEAALMQIENQTEKILDNVRQDFYGLTMRESTSRMMNRTYESMSYSETRAFIDEIYSVESYSGYVKSYAFINFKYGWVISNKGVIPISSVKNKEWLKALKGSDGKIFWLNHGGEEESDKERGILTEPMKGREDLMSEYVNHQYLTFVIKMPTYTQDSDAAFIVNMKQEVMEQLFKDSIGNSSLLVFDRDNRLVYSDHLPLTKYYEDMAKTGKEWVSGATAETSDGTYDIVLKKAPSSGWTYIAGYNYLAAQNELHQIIITTAGMIVLILVITGILGSLGTFRVYRPVRELVSSVKGMVPVKEEHEEGEDEFSLINHGLHALAGHNEELQDLIDKQKSQLTELFAFRLIGGRMNDNEITQTMERLQVTLKPCLCMVSVLFCQREKENTKQLEQDVLNIELMKRLPDEIREMLAFPPFIHTRAIVMVIDGVTEEKLEIKLLALRNCLSVFVNGECKGFMNMGVSRVFISPAGFCNAYHESLEALKVNEHSDRDEDTEGISMEDSSITYYGDLTGHSGNTKGYNLILDGAIKEAVDHGSKEEAFGVVNEFLREINKSGVALFEQHYYLYRFLLAILTVPADAGIPIYDLFPEGEEDLFQQFNQLYDYKALRQFYETKVILPVIKRLNQLRKSSSEMVLEKVMELVENSKGDLTLSECARRLGYHPSYIWRVLKNTKDITFTDYIAEQKLELAKRLLEETDLSVAEIAERLSYSNAQNFIRLFKKHLEITPGQYRKKMKGRSNISDFHEE